MTPALYVLLAAMSAGGYWTAGWIVRRAYDHTRQQQGGQR